MENVGGVVMVMDHEEEFKAIVMEEGLSQRQADELWIDWQYKFSRVTFNPDALREAVRSVLPIYQLTERMYQEVSNG